MPRTKPAPAPPPSQAGVLRAALARLGRSQAALARALGLGPDRVGHVLQGRRALSAPESARWAVALGIDPGALHPDAPAWLAAVGAVPGRRIELVPAEGEPGSWVPRSEADAALCREVAGSWWGGVGRLADQAAAHGVAVVTRPDLPPPPAPEG